MTSDIGQVANSKPAFLEFHDVSKSFGTHKVLNQINLTVAEGETSISASDGDVVIIYRSSVYGLVGTGKYLVINGPAFQEDDDQYLLRKS